MTKTRNDARLGLVWLQVGESDGSLAVAHMVKLNKSLPFQWHSRGISGRRHARHPARSGT